METLKEEWNPGFLYLLREDVYGQRRWAPAYFRWMESCSGLQVPHFQRNQLVHVQWKTTSLFVNILETFLHEDQWRNWVRLIPAKRLKRIIAVVFRYVKGCDLSSTFPLKLRSQPFFDLLGPPIDWPYRLFTISLPLLASSDYIGQHGNHFLVYTLKFLTPSHLSSARFRAEGRFKAQAWHWTASHGPRPFFQFMTVRRETSFPIPAVFFHVGDMN